MPARAPIRKKSRVGGADPIEVGGAITAPHDAQMPRSVSAIVASPYALPACSQPDDT